MRPLVRPLWVMGLTWLCTCLLGMWLPVWGLWAGAAVSGLGILLCAVIPALRARHAVLLALVTVVFAVIALLYQEVCRYQPVQQMNRQVVSLRGEVYKSGGVTELRVLEGDLPAGTRLRFSVFSGEEEPEAYDIVESQFTLYLSSSSGLELRTTKASGLWGTVFPTRDVPLSVSPGTPPVFSFLSEWRRQATVGILSQLNGDPGAVVTAICFGETSSLSDRALGSFRSCGVAHLFAVSGLHLSILVQAFGGLLKLLRVPRLLRSFLVGVLVLLFAGIVGWTPSVTRAGIVCLMVLLGDCLHREADARNSLGLSLLVLLVAEPFAAYDASLLLSFLATFGLLFWAPALQQVLVDAVPLRAGPGALWRFAAGTIAVTVAATLATLPVTVLYFGYVSLVGVLSNLLMTIPASLVLILGCLSSLLLPLSAAFLYRPFFLLAGWLCRYLLWISGTLADFPLATVSVQKPFLVVWLLGSLLLAGLGWYTLRRRGICRVVCFSAVILCVGLSLNQVVMRDVVRIRAVPEQSDLAVCLFYGERASLVIAPTDTRDLYAVRSVLRQEGVSRLDAVFLLDHPLTADAYLQLVLEEYLSEDTVVYTDMEQGPVMPLGKTGSAEGSWGFLYVSFGETQMAFDAGGTFGLLPETVCGVFSTRVPPSFVLSDTTFAVVQGAGQETSLPERYLTDAVRDIPWLWVSRDGKVTVKP